MCNGVGGRIRSMRQEAFEGGRLGALWGQTASAQRAADKVVNTWARRHLEAWDLPWGRCWGAYLDNHNRIGGRLARGAFGAGVPGVHWFYI